MSKLDGGVADYSVTCGIVEAKLYGFAINSAELTNKHTRWLDEFVVPLLAEGGSVSLVGEASRTGSASYNKALSQQRALRALNHLHRQLGGATCRHDVGSISGGGEAAAKEEGLRDGTENAFYRAVLVRAWGNPSVPEPPQPKSDIPKTVRRVVMRRWGGIQSRTLRTGSPAADGELGASLAGFVRNAYNTATRGGSDQREYAAIPADHVVVTVHDEFELQEIHSFGVSTVRTSHVIRYQWGPHTPTVTLHEIQRHNIRIYGEPRETRSTQVYPRSKIWKMTTAPDAKVFG